MILSEEKGGGDMRRFYGPRVGLLARIVLLAVAFAVAVVLQIGIGQYQSTHVFEPMEEGTRNIQAISQFLNQVESCMTALENYRWDYGNAASLITTLREHKLASQQNLNQIQMDLSRVGEEQYLLANASQTTFGTLADSLDQIISYLLVGRSTEAAELYYTRTEPCGTYLRQYTQQLLEQAILDNQDAYTRLSTLNERLSQSQTVILMICAALGCMVAYSLIGLLNSVGQMSRAAKAIGRGQLDTPDVVVRQEDEVGHLAATFNEMKHYMKKRMELLEEKAEMERKLRKTETQALEYQTLMERAKLQQLRSQINPHFLFNTLNVILYTSQQEGAMRTHSLIVSLSKLLRYALGSNESQVPLAKEVNIVDELYALYHARFGDRVRMRWNISPEVDLPDTMVPSFLLQPLVENAFKHGLAPKEEGGCVDIFIAPEGKTLVIRVVDDGVGMDSEALEHLRQSLREPPASGEHIGIYNVAARLRLRGGECGLEIHSEPGRGTEARLWLPLVMLWEEEEDDGEDPDCG